MSEPSKPIESIQDLFAAEHRLFDELGRGLISALVAHDDAKAFALWIELRTVIFVHVESEDRFMIPALSRRRAQEARALLAEHGLVRARVVEIDGAFAQGARSIDTLRAFVHELNAHARHEARVLYSWSDTWLDEHERALLVAYREEASKASSAASSSSTFTGFVR